MHFERSRFCFQVKQSHVHRAAQLRWWWLSILVLPPAFIAQSVKTLPAMQETWVRFLGWEDPLEKEVASHSSIFAWEIPWAE